MPVQRSQNKRRPQATRSDELLTGVQAIEQAEAGPERTSGGRFAKGASTVQRKGGKALKSRTKLSHQTGLSALLALPAFKPYLHQAKAFARHHTAHLARTVGGGQCSAGPASVVTTASLQLAASRYLFDEAAKAGDADLFLKAAKLGDQSRANLLSASDMAAADALAQPSGMTATDAALARIRGAANQ